MSNEVLTEQKLQNRFYRCQFRGLIKDLDRFGVAKNVDERITSCLYRVAALYEMHEMASFEHALNGLESIIKTQEGRRLDYLHALGRVAYLRENLDDAHRLFGLILHEAKCVQLRAKALIGIGNVHFSRKNPRGMLEAIVTLDGLELGDYPVLAISRTILKGNCYLQLPESLESARTAFLEALTQASGKAWTFFIQRALYGLALTAKAKGKSDETRCILSLLKAMIGASQSVYMSYILVRDFTEEEFSFGTSITFDDRDMRINLRGEWLSFHEKPLLYRFLRILSETQEFVQKDELIRRLWPGETYNPTVHDLRVYDLARRARAIVEAYEEQPVVLLSGRAGYKLATKTFKENCP